MKIDINRIPTGGLTLEEEIPPAALDLETEIVKFRSPVRIRADISKITNALTMRLVLNARICMNCARCLNEFEIVFKKDLQLNYPINKTEMVIDLDPDIRQEIILDYPIKPLCNPDCKGLCPKCGINLNEGDCNCK